MLVGFRVTLFQADVARRRAFIDEGDVGLVGLVVDMRHTPDLFGSGSKEAERTSFGHNVTPDRVATLLRCPSVGLIRLTGHPRLAWDAYRRLIASFGNVVAGVDARHFEADLDTVREGEDERSLDFAAMREVARRHLRPLS
jgi:hypothetical protein